MLEDSARAQPLARQRDHRGSGPAQCLATRKCRLSQGLTIEELERRIAELTEQLNAKRRTAVAPKPPTTRYKRSLERCG